MLVPTAGSSPWEEGASPPSPTTRRSTTSSSPWRHAREPRILFLPTASGDPNGQIAAFKSTFGERSCRARHLSLFRLEHEPADLRTLILGQDIVYVGGGSMRNLLAIWREHGLDCSCARRGRPASCSPG